MRNEDEKLRLDYIWSAAAKNLRNGEWHTERKRTKQLKKKSRKKNSNPPQSMDVDGKV